MIGEGRKALLFFVPVRGEKATEHPGETQNISQNVENFSTFLLTFPKKCV